MKTNPLFLFCALLLAVLPAPAAQRTDATSEERARVRAERSAQPYSELKRYQPAMGQERGNRRGTMQSAQTIRRARDLSVASAPLAEPKRGRNGLTERSAKPAALSFEPVRQRGNSKTAKAFGFEPIRGAVVPKVLAYPGAKNTGKAAESTFGFTPVRGARKNQPVEGSSRVFEKKGRPERGFTGKTDPVNQALHAHQGMAHGGATTSDPFRKSAYTRSHHVAQQTLNQKSPWAALSAKHETKEATPDAVPDRTHTAYERRTAAHRSYLR